MMFDPNRRPLYVIGFAAVVSGLFTAGIMALHVLTEPVVKANERLLEEKAFVELFGLGDPSKLDAAAIADLVCRRIRRTRINEGTELETELLAAFKRDVPAGAEGDVRDRANIVGYGFPVRGVGFWAMIEGWLAVTPDGDKALGVVFLRHSETPGLGGRITERAFREQFRGLDVSVPETGKFIYVQRGAAREAVAARHVEAITGATGTSTAVESLLNESLRRFRKAAAAAKLLGPAAPPAGGR